ncbi:hypothetical protein [Nostoc punctiforme]|uniref:hypothetical protein n=1 Tax=Nostoc punctiforme TaxID=272131 RepID=UPI0002D95501|nr:hypothetical protein [Nostoc punctiforme]
MPFLTIANVPPRIAIAAVIFLLGQKLKFWNFLPHFPYPPHLSLNQWPLSHGFRYTETWFVAL